MSIGDACSTAIACVHGTAAKRQEHDLAKSNWIFTANIIKERNLPLLGIKSSKNV
jgi:hypothetical protein